MTKMMTRPAKTRNSCPQSEIMGRVRTVTLPAEYGDISRSENDTPARCEEAMIRQGKAQERLLSAAEIALAFQSIHTYRRWFTCWRQRGVRTNDLLDMTWVWHQRSRFG